MDANVRAPLHQQCGYEHVRMRPCKELRTDHYGVNYKLFAERVVRQARTLRSDAATAHYCTVLTTPSATAALRARCTRARQLGRLHSHNCHQRRDVERRWSKWSCTTRGCAKAPQILLRPQRLCSQRCTTCIASRDKRLRCGPSVWLTYSEAKMRLECGAIDRSMSNYFKFRFDEFKNVDSQ